ncbi:hypothetical protein [Fuchsiella alkaliacetigena]|uniref:hypothetical protein n=1 Tax=Fuchsiella alkaliacetigena TaxID=957042 RepID=UPI00200A997F|nr:hypothetical protein [Fuchsiella alkaliacetigena]MCK8825492.1 hypothetical protein [Fuchsiella alkaliacetigena]
MKRIVSIAMVMLLVLGFSSLALARGNNSRLNEAEHRMEQECVEYLDLSTEQQEELAQLQAERQELRDEDRLENRNEPREEIEARDSRRGSRER